MRFVLALLIAVMAMVAGPAGAQDYPARPDGPVLDAANVLPPAEEAALDRKLRRYNRETGNAVIVATVESLDGAEPFAYAQGLAETWGIGGEQTEQGVLMLVAPSEREVFITTSRGVQTRLTDISTGRIVRNVVLPAFREGDLPGGIAAGVDAIIERLNMGAGAGRSHRGGRGRRRGAGGRSRRGHHWRRDLLGRDDRGLHVHVRARRGSRAARPAAALRRGQRGRRRDPVVRDRQCDGRRP
ncbi:YgcG family protein [Croceicoccus sp. YJ47]|uniref:TPM domain-containing protein n=1 Tax=Croceicoccus sp. YJ47 TaxID=2798724 RepID=UPI001F28FC01|nr:TPM domain-containing protein [Croceicoccus sp. YJ47]